MTKHTKGWTPERRAAQRERILKNKPWEKSTGPKTTEGKKASSGNSIKTGLRSDQMNRIRKYLKESRAFLLSIKGTKRLRW